MNGNEVAIRLVFLVLGLIFCAAYPPLLFIGIPLAILIGAAMLRQSGGNNVHRNHRNS